MTRTQFENFMVGYLEGTGNNWTIEVSNAKNKKKKWPKYDWRNHTDTAYAAYQAAYNIAMNDPEMSNRYTMYITDKDGNIIMQSDEFTGYQRNAWSEVSYGKFIKTLKQV